jgi:RecB family endonuclease NucS
MIRRFCFQYAIALRNLIWFPSLLNLLARQVALNREPVVLAEKPVIESALLLIREAFLKRRTVLIVGNCWVEYRGRASSKLEAGERILILKEDGSLLVHRSVGYEPVNWQPPGCLFYVGTSSAGKVLQIRAMRRKPAESVRISFDNIFFVSVLNLFDTGVFELYATEEDMQKAILMQPLLIEEGFKPISYEKKVEPGFVDVYGVDKQGRFVVVEIKRKTASQEAALQLAKYVKAVRSLVNREVRGILAAPDLAKGVQRLLSSLGLDFKAVDPKKCAEVLSKPETKRLQEYFDVKS